MTISAYRVCAAAWLVLVNLAWGPTNARALEDTFELPPFSSDRAGDWLNSPPLDVAALRGKVVLLDFWTFGCWNCYRSFPWLRDLEHRLTGEPFVVIGIHSPEFSHEHEPAAVAAKVKEFELTHPVMLDNDFAYWKALRNRYWPSFFLVDKRGQIRYLHIGETHIGDRRARQIKADIRGLLAE